MISLNLQNCHTINGTKIETSGMPQSGHVRKSEIVVATINGILVIDREDIPFLSCGDLRIGFHIFLVQRFMCCTYILYTGSIQLQLKLQTH